MPISRTLVPSKREAFWRRMMSSVAGCCHLPGVETAGEGVGRNCCCDRCGVAGEVLLLFCGVRLSLGSMDVAVASAEEADGRGVVLLLVD